MDNAIAHYLLANPQPVLKHQAHIPWPTPPSFIVQHNDIGYRISLRSVRVSCPSLCAPSLLSSEVGLAEELKYLLLRST